MPETEQCEPGVRDFGPVRFYKEISRLPRLRCASAWLLGCTLCWVGPPGVYRAFRDLTRDLGPIARSSAVFHGFPSDTEGEAYCRAAGVPWPPERQ